MDIIYLLTLVAQSSEEILSVLSAFEQCMHDGCKGNFSELLTRSIAKSINNPLVFKLFETFGDENVIGESTHLPRLSNTQIVLVLLGTEPSQTEDPEGITSKRAQ